MEKYFSFQGTATRSEYWGVMVVASIAAFVVALFGGAFIGFGASEDSVFTITLGFAILIADVVGTFWVSLATSVRRCRDANINVWWAAASVVPYLGFIITIVVGCLKTNKDA